MGNQQCHTYVTPGFRSNCCVTYVTRGSEFLHFIILYSVLYDESRIYENSSQYLWRVIGIRVVGTRVIRKSTVYVYVKIRILHFFEILFC